MTPLLVKAYHAPRKMSALQVAALANLVVIIAAELSASAAWYSLYGVYGTAVMVTTALTLIASALPLITIIIYMTKHLEQKNKELAESKAKLKRQSEELLRQKEYQLCRTTEQLTQALDDVATANRVKTHCLALTSHELRTPLNAILTCSEAMQREIFGPIGDAKYYEYADHIQKSGTHLLAVIDDILDITEIDGGRRQLDEECIAIDDCLDDLKILVDEVAKRYGISLTISKSREVSLIWADPVKLKQILVNLVTNAIKYTHSGGKCSVEVRLGEDDQCEFHVIDSGIATAVQDGFDRNARSVTERDPLGLMRKSTGLGLPLCKALAELHGGTIDMVREPGIGSRVIVRFPASRHVPTRFDSQRRIATPPFARTG